MRLFTYKTLTCKCEFLPYNTLHLVSTLHQRISNNSMYLLQSISTCHPFLNQWVKSNFKLSNTRGWRCYLFSLIGRLSKQARLSKKSSQSSSSSSSVGVGVGGGGAGAVAGGGMSSFNRGAVSQFINNKQMYSTSLIGQRHSTFFPHCNSLHLFFQPLHW